MTIKPALNSYEWEDNGFEGDPPEDIARIIAFANAGLPDADARKITREMVTAMQAVAGGLDRRPSVHEIQAVRSFADALESYLPPEGT